MKKEDRIEQILDCTLELVGEKPLAAIRTAEIASRAGITEGAMFKYFSSKDEILEGIQKRYLTIGHPLKSSEEITTVKDFHQFIDSYLKSLITITPQRLAYLRLLLQISMEQHNISFEKYEKIRNGFWAIMEDRIEYGKKHWGFRKDFETSVQVRLFHLSVLMFVIEQEVFGTKTIDPRDLGEMKNIAIENLFSLMKGK